MKLEMSTRILPILNPGLYGTLLEDYYDDLRTEEDIEMFKEQLCFECKSIINEIFMRDDINEYKLSVDNVTFHSPQFYNYENDWIEFDLEIPDEIIENIKRNAPMLKLVDNFFKYIQKNFGSHEGFMSFFPTEKDKFVAAIQGNGKEYDFERAISMYFMYEFEVNNNVDLDDYQKDLEDNMRDFWFENFYILEEDEEYEY